MPYALCPMPYAPLTKRLIQQALFRLISRAGMLALGIGRTPTLALLTNDLSSF
jgi:hypothetical protein